MKVIIIDNYDSFTFNLYQMLQPFTAESILVFRNDRERPCCRTSPRSIRRPPGQTPR